MGDIPASPEMKLLEYATYRNITSFEPGIEKSKDATLMRLLAHDYLARRGEGLAIFFIDLHKILNAMLLCARRTLLGPCASGTTGTNYDEYLDSQVQVVAEHERVL